MGRNAALARLMAMQLLVVVVQRHSGRQLDSDAAWCC
jgi:hypothetical protein